MHCRVFECVASNSGRIGQFALPSPDGRGGGRAARPLGMPVRTNSNFKEQGEIETSPKRTRCASEWHTPD